MSIPLKIIYLRAESYRRKQGLVRAGTAVLQELDRRSTLVEITPDGRAAVDRLLTGIRTVQRTAMETLSHGERIRPARLNA